MWMHRQRLSTTAVFAVASILGLLIAASDVLSPIGDDSAQFTVLLWLVSSGVLGFARPGRPWRWAISLGPWLPVTHLVRRGLGQPAAIAPNTYGTILVLFPVSVAVCLVGAYGGAAIRRFLLPPKPSLG
jgi:hypothetical protein